MLKEKDLVIIKEDAKPIIYILERIENNNAYLKGYSHRICLTKELDLLALAPTSLIEKEQMVNEKYHKNIKTRAHNNSKMVLGRILHIDGDEDYLNSCLSLYEEVGIFADGICISEKKIKDVIESIILETTPDILVITGHDTFNNQDKKDITNYENSQEFVKTLRIIRKHFSMDNLIVIIGACSSHFEALIANGANFASSPARINIHTYDPAVIAIKVASTSCNKIVDFNSIVNYIENGKDAFGGIETKGRLKILY